MFPAVPSMVPCGRFTLNVLLGPTSGPSQACWLSAGLSAVPRAWERGVGGASGLYTWSPSLLEAVLLHRVGRLPGLPSEKPGTILTSPPTGLSTSPALVPPAAHWPNPSLIFVQKTTPSIIKSFSSLHGYGRNSML